MSALSPLPSLAPVRDEIAATLARLTAHAAAAASHAVAGNDRALAFEMRCAAVAMLATASLVDELRPSRQGGRRP